MDPTVEYLAPVHRATLSRRRLLSLAAVGLGGTLAATLLSACSSAPAPSPTAKPAEATRPAAATGAQAAPAAKAASPFGKPEQEKPEVWWVRDIQMSSGSVLAGESAAAAHIGQKLSFFEEEGIQPVLKPFVSGGDLPNMMSSGNVAMGTTTPFLTIIMAASGLKVKYVCGHCQIEGNQGFVVRTANIKAPSDLVGKKIGHTLGWSGVPGFRMFLKEQGIDPSQVEMVNGAPPDLVAAFGKGDIVAYAGWEPWLSNVEKQGGTRWMTGTKRLVNGKDEPMEYMILHSGMVVLEDYLAKNPNTVAAYIRGLKRGVDFINQNTDQAIEILTEPMRLPKDDVARMVKQVKWDMAIDDRFIKGTVIQTELLTELGRITRRPDPKEYVDLTILSKLFPEQAQWKPT